MLLLWLQSTVAAGQACQSSMPSSWSTSRMSIRASMDPQEMSWPGNRAPWMGLNGYGWRSEQQRGKGSDPGSGTPSTPVRPMLFVYDASFPPSAEARSHRRTTASTYTVAQAGRADIVSDITLFLPSLRLCFSRSRFTEILLRLEFPALFPLVFPIWAVCLFSPFPPFAPSPGSLIHLLAHSFHTLGTCHTLRLSLMGLCNPPASHLHAPQQTHRISCSQLWSCSVA